MISFICLKEEENSNLRLFHCEDMPVYLQPVCERTCIIEKLCWMLDFGC